MSAAPDALSAATPAPSPGHARQMDAIYGLQRHIYDLTRKYYLLGRDGLIAGLNVPDDGRVLEIGCGTARNMALAARTYPAARIYGLDISAAMLKTAQAKLAAQGLAARCHLAEADAEAFDAAALFGVAQFDRVFLSYTISMIPAWQQALDNGCRLLAPGGELHVVDFGQQDRLPRWFARLLQGWLARFHVTPRAALFTVGQGLAARHGLTLETHSLYRDYARSLILRRAPDATGG